MHKPENPPTILVLGDKADYDSYKKFNKEKKFIKKSGFYYVKTSYPALLKKGLPKIKGDKVIIFLFFPFFYWNKFIENRQYKGIYGSSMFFIKFRSFWKRINSILKKELKGKNIFFMNEPLLCAEYRDKKALGSVLKRSGSPFPKRYDLKSVRETEKLLKKGHNLFMKPRYGSMGKGITFLSWASWKTNFGFKKGKIISRKSDKGWRFTDVTGNRGFLGKLINNQNILTEEEIRSALLNDSKIDLRVYVVFGRVVYIYPRRNKVKNITTNITQGGKGDPEILKKLPRPLIQKIRKLSERTAKALSLNFVGMDIMIGENLKDLYVIDVNVFPGLPKRRTFNISKKIIEMLSKKDIGYQAADDGII